MDWIFDYDVGLWYSTAYDMHYDQSLGVFYQRVPQNASEQTGDSEQVRALRWDTELQSWVDCTSEVYSYLYNTDDYAEEESGNNEPSVPDHIEITLLSLRIDESSISHLFPKTSHHDNPQCSTVAQSENQLDSPHVTDSENYQHNQGNDSNEERCDENDNNVKKLDDKEEEESKKLEWVTVSSDKESISDPSEWFALTDTKIIFGSSFDIARCDEDRPAKRRRLNQQTREPSYVNEFERLLLIGRESSCHFQLQDVSVSKIHCEVRWRQVYHENYFIIKDRGSLHGTYILSPQAKQFERLSAPRVQSEERPLHDGDIIRVGNCYLKIKFLYEYLPNDNQREAINENTTSTSYIKRSARELNSYLYKSVFGLARRHPSEKLASVRDRAQERRKLQGIVVPPTAQSAPVSPANSSSTYRPAPGNLIAALAPRYSAFNQPVSEAVHTTTSASPAVSISTPLGIENKGNQMLRKLGWRDGQALGARNQGILEPLQPIVQHDKKGLGYSARNAPE